MPTGHSPLGESLSDAEICRQFQAGWDADVPVSIETALRSRPPAQRAELLQQLLIIELTELEKRGKQSNRWDFYSRFPAFREAIDRAFSQLHAPPAPPLPPQPVPAATLSTIHRPVSESPSQQPNPSTSATLSARYQLKKWLGSGKFGEVHLATDTRLERDVAVKLLRAQRGQIPHLLREARLAAQLRHPGIVTVHDIVDADEHTAFIVMEYVSGEPLSTVLKTAAESSQRSLHALVGILAKVADALHHAHGQGLVHRDLKPANIIVDKHGDPRIVDFGLAVCEQEQSTRGGEVAGTPCYMAPEQVRGEVDFLDGRCDIWALGVILYESLVGRLPFQGVTRRELYREIEHRHPRPPRMIDSTVPPALEAICLKCLAKSAADRYTNAGDVAVALQGIVSNVGSPEPASLPAGPLGREESAGLLHAVWDMLDPDLQDAFSLAYNKKRRAGKNRISTRDLFQALLRVQDASLTPLLASLPAGAMPEPIDRDLAVDDTVIREDPLLSDCVRDSLRAFRKPSSLPRKLSPADLFVDIGKHGHGPSVQQLREHGVSAEELDSRVVRLRLEILRRTKDS